MPNTYAHVQRYVSNNVFHSFNKGVNIKMATKNALNNSIGIPTTICIIAKGNDIFLAWYLLVTLSRRISNDNGRVHATITIALASGGFFGTLKLEYLAASER